MKKHILLILLLLLVCIFGAMAESNPHDDIMAALESMTTEQRMETAATMMKILIKQDGIEALNNVYNSLIQAYAESVSISANDASEEDFETLLSQQPLAVINTEYLIQSDEWKTLYPDLLSAVIQNNSAEDIKNAVIAFVAWDKNGLPVKIEGQFDFMGGSYIKKVDYDDVNLIPGACFGENKGFALAEGNTIATFKAIAVSYETFEEKQWTNPYFEDFCDQYEGKKLN